MYYSRDGYKSRWEDTRNYHVSPFERLGDMSPYRISSANTGSRPSALAQKKLIQDCYARAGLDPTNPAHRPQYFEAHGNDPHLRKFTYQ